MNSVNLVGRLSQDPKSIKGGALFTLAIDNKFKDGADFIPCIVFGKQGENLLKYCKKGKLISVVGSLNTFTISSEESKRSSMNVNVQSINYLSSGSSNSNNIVNEQPKENDFGYDDAPPYFE